VSVAITANAVNTVREKAVLPRSLSYSLADPIRAHTSGEPRWIYRTPGGGGNAGNRIIVYKCVEPQDSAAWLSWKMRLLVQANYHAETVTARFESVSLLKWPSTEPSAEPSASLRWALGDERVLPWWCGLDYVEELSASSGYIHVCLISLANISFMTLQQSVVALSIPS